MKKNKLDSFFEFFEKYFKFLKRIRNILKYLFFGFVATIADIILLYVFTEFLNLFYLVSSIISYSVGIVISFLGNKKYTFKNIKNKTTTHKFLDFTLISIIGLILNTILIFVFTEFIGLWYVLSKIVSTIIIFLIKYTAHKKIVFNN